MNIDIICVGKIKEKYLVDAINEYTKRLSKFANVNILEVKDEKTPDNPSENEKNIILKTEGDRIDSFIKKGAFVFGLCIEGKQVESKEFASKISDIMVNGYSDIQFIIGGSFGLHEDIKKRVNYKLSFSKMTFPHQLMRLILLEQVYRAYKINNHEPYHK